MKTGQIYELGDDELGLAIGDWIVQGFKERRESRAQIEPPVSPTALDRMTPEEMAIDQAEREAYFRSLDGERDPDDFDDSETDDEGEE